MSNTKKNFDSEVSEEIVTTQQSKLTKKFGNHIISVSIKSVAARLLSLLLVKILVITLPKSDYGLYTLWFSIMSLLVSFSTSTFTAALWRFLPSYQIKDTERRAVLLSTATAGSITLSVVGMAFLYTLHMMGIYEIAQDPVFLFSLGTISALTIAYILKEIVLAVSGTEQNSREILASGLLIDSASFILAAAFTLVFLDFRSTMIGLSLGIGIPAIFIYSYHLRRYGYSAPNQSVLKNCFFYGGPVLIVSATTSALTVVVNSYLGIHSGLAEVATLGVAMTIAAVIGFVVKPPLQAYNAFLVNSYESGSLEASNRVSIKIVEIFVSFATIAFILINAAAPMMINLVASEAYLDAIPVLPFTVASILILLFSRFWSLRLYLLEKTHLVGGVFLLSLAVFIITCITAIPVLGIEAAGIALVLQSLTVLVLLVPLGQRKLPLPFQKSFIGKWISALGLLYLLNIVLAAIAISTLISGIILSCTFLAIMAITRAHRLKDIRKMIRVLLVPLSK